MLKRLLQRLSGKDRRRSAARREPAGPGQTPLSRRRADIAALDDAEALLPLLDEPELATAARKRLSELFAAGLDPLRLAADDAGLSRRRQLLEAATEARHWQPLLSSLEGDDLLADVACHHPLTTVRQAAAARLVDEAVLRRVEKVCRDRDKVVARQLRDRLEPLRQSRQRLTAIDARLEELATDLRHLARSEDSLQQAQRLQWLTEQQQQALAQRASLAVPLEPFGQSLPDLPPAVAEFDTILAEIEAAAAAEREQAAAAARAAAAEQEAATAQQAAADSLALLAQQVAKRLDGHPQPASELTGLRAALSMEQARWQEACRDHPPAQELARRQADTLATLENLVAALNRLEAMPPVPALPEQADHDTLEQLARDCAATRTELDWPAALPLPACLQQLDAVSTELDQRLKQQQQRLQQRQDGLRRQLGRLEGALKKGDLRQARALQAEIDSGIAEAGCPPSLETRLQRLAAQLDELVDWQQFATAPKRRELCAEMEALAADSELAPEPRATRVRRLREQWNELGPPRDEDSQTLAQRFDTAAEQAFAPCRAFFEARAERQQHHTEQRERICAELETFVDGYDWQQPDWRAVETIYQEARREWRRHADVDARGHGLNRRYHGLLRRLREQLQPRWEANIARKQALLEQAEALAAGTETDTRTEATRRAKALQAEWKTVDITPRSVDRKLWQDFRAACDRIFERAGAEQEARQQAFDQQLADLQAAFDALSAQYAEAERALPSTLPSRELQRCGQQLDSLLAAAPRGSRSDGLDALQRRLQQLRRQDRDLTRQQREAERLQQAATRLEHLAPVAEASEAARMAVIDLELALGVDSPEADAPLRLQRQVKRLEAGLRGSEQGDPVTAAIEALAETPPCAALLDRARAALASARPDQP